MKQIDLFAAPLAAVDDEDDDEPSSDSPFFILRSFELEGGQYVRRYRLTGAELEDRFTDADINRDENTGGYVTISRFNFGKPLCTYHAWFRPPDWPIRYAPTTSSGNIEHYDPPAMPRQYRTAPWPAT